MIKMYRKQPIEAEQFDGSQRSIFGYKIELDDRIGGFFTKAAYYSLIIGIEDEPIIEVGDWIVKEADEIKVLTDEEFQQQYAELPVIPKAVAEWIEACKKKHISIGDMLCSERRPEVMRDWMAMIPGTYQFDYGRYRKYQEVVARAWLDGYQVEEQHDTRTD